MKIIAGISNATSDEEIKAYSDAGVDDFFLGYVPNEWSSKYGWEVSCNRRFYSIHHYRTFEQLANVAELIHRNGKRVFLTLNAHEYNQKQITLILKIIDSIDSIPINAFIVSNLALMLKIREAGINKPINISIGSGCNSFEAIQFYIENISNIGRVILPRKITIKEVQNIAAKANKKDIKLEVFALSDPCHFNDEYCFTWHGSVQPSLCESPMYQNKKVEPILTNKNWKNEISQKGIEVYFHKRGQIENKIKDLKTKYNYKHPHYIAEKTDYPDKIILLNRLGKCGICAFEKFKEFGIEAVKLPLRGHHIDGNLALIKLVKQVLDKKNSTPEFCRSLLKAPQFCSGKNCYYNYPYAN